MVTNGNTGNQGNQSTVTLLTKTMVTNRNTANQGNQPTVILLTKAVNTAPTKHCTITNQTATDALHCSRNATYFRPISSEREILAPPPQCGHVPNSHYQVSRKSVQREPTRSLRVEGRTNAAEVLCDGQHLAEQGTATLQQACQHLLHCNTSS